MHRLPEMTKTRYLLPMHRVTFIVYPGFELLDTAGPASAFNSANRALSQAGKQAFYSVALVSAHGGSISSSSSNPLGTRCIPAARPRHPPDHPVAGALQAQ